MRERERERKKKEERVGKTQNADFDLIEGDGRAQADQWSADGIRKMEKKKRGKKRREKKKKSKSKLKMIWSQTSNDQSKQGND